MVGQVDSGLVALYLKSMHLRGFFVGEGTDERGSRPRQGNSGILWGCPEQGMPNICRADTKASHIQKLVLTEKRGRAETK